MVRYFLALGAAVGLSGVLLTPTAAAQDKTKLAAQARAVLEANCYRCHGQNGSNEYNINYMIDLKQLVEHKKVIPGNPKKSRIFKAMESETMPPENENPRPSAADIAIVKQWIEAGAPTIVEEPKDRPFVATQDVLAAMRDHLRKLPKEDRPHQRYFTLTHLHNFPAAKVKDGDLPIYRAALAKLINSLSWKNAIVLPVPVDKHQTVLAIDLRDLDWDKQGLWQGILKYYPYGLTHDYLPDVKASRDLAAEVYELSGSTLPAVRADWFISTAARPPLYHALLRIPEHAYDLEQLLKVDVVANFQRGKLARAGFGESGVSGHNRLVERHEAAYGAYWKSYDFKSSDGVGNLFLYPLGPVFHKNPYERFAFKHDGGEIIFNLPNGLQGYMLVNGKDQRIDAGPIEVVSDSKKTSGTPSIVNGLSCMACHKHGPIPLKDTVRLNTNLKGDALDKVRQLYLEPKEMDKLVKKDEDRFLRALEEATGSYLRVGKAKDQPIRDFPESISAIARWYLSQDLGAEEVARELGLPNAKKLVAAIQANQTLRNLGLAPLAQGNTIKREVLESVRGFVSPFQETARLLELGTPRR